MNARRLLIATLALVAPANGAAASPMDMIEFWVGDGPNSAAIAIDWDGDNATDDALVWGYRWTGAATGEDMLRAVVAEDERLFARLIHLGAGLTVTGLGYDQNADGAFAITQTGVVFNTQGVFEAFGDAALDTADGGLSIDPADRYREGWFDGFWHIGRGVSSGAEIDWTTSGTGPAGRPLSDGDWDGYAFAETMFFNEFAQNLTPALPPALDGDFNADGRVDAADYTVWRDASGPIEEYLLWRENFGSISSVARNQASPPTQIVSVPEAGAAACAFAAGFLSLCQLRRTTP